MEVAGRTVAASGLVRHVRTVEHAVAQSIRLSGRSQLIIATGFRCARRIDVAVIGQFGTVEAVLELRGYPVSAARGEQPAAVLAGQRHFVSIGSVVRLASGLKELTNEIQRSLITFRVYQVSEI